MQENINQHPEGTYCNRYNVDLVTMLNVKHMI